MTSRVISVCTLVAIATILNLSRVTWATDDFSTTIQPMLQTTCVACHGPDDSEGGLDLSSYEGLMRGGRSGPAVTPGSVASSRLYLMSAGKKEPAMPPDPDESWNDTQLQRLADWIQAGAVGPVGEPLSPSLRVPDVEKRHRQAEAITALASSTDGNLIALAHFGKIVLGLHQHQLVEPLGTLSIDEPRCEIGGLPGKVTALQFLNAGDQLLVATGIEGLQGEAIILDIKACISQLTVDKISKSHDYKELDPRSFSGHRDLLYAAVVSPDGQWLATAGYDRTIQIWRMGDSQLHQTIRGHNGAVFSLDFSPDSSVLLSGSADQTVKVWDVQSGQRLDTLSQPEGEVFASRFVSATGAGQPRIVAIGADNRLRVWQWRSRTQAAINPLLETRFVDETPLVSMAISPDGERLVVASQAGNLKLMSTATWDVQRVLEPIAGTPTDLRYSADGRQILIADLQGNIHQRQVTEAVGAESAEPRVRSIAAIYLHDLVATEVSESEHASLVMPQVVPRHVVIRGAIGQGAEVDAYQWHAEAGEVWAIDVDPLQDDGQASSTHPSLAPSGNPSQLDPMVSILDEEGAPVRRIRLQAIRESYFTFRGKDSMQSDDFRLFGQQEMQLDQWLFASGEVTRLWMHPRGPDSGFDMYPGGGQRWTYFGTSHVTHALGEPAYIVKPLLEGEEPIANGLPVFDIYYENDDDPMRRANKGSRLLFSTPQTGNYTVFIRDTRGQGGEGFQYQARIRPARPDFQASVSQVTQGLLVGAGREFTVTVERCDDFDGPVEFSITGLPPGVEASLPLVVEAGQRSAQGTLWIADDQEWPEVIQTEVVATADILGQTVSRSAGSLGALKKAEKTLLIPRIALLEADEVSTSAGQANVEAEGREAFVTTLSLSRGATLSAKVMVERSEEVKGEISFGNALAARNPAHGVYVDNIGLNGLLLMSDMNDREFFITADPKTASGRRPFFLKAEVDGGITTLPVWLEVQE